LAGRRRLEASLRTFTLTSSRDFYETSNAILERMLVGFEITLAPVPVVYPLSDGQVLLAVAFGPALIAFLVTAVLVGRMNRGRRFLFRGDRLLPAP